MVNIESTVRQQSVAVVSVVAGVMWWLTSEWRGSAGRQVGDDYVKYTNVTRDDVHVLQCNASNVHGYLFVNAFLNVLGRYTSFRL